MKNFAYSFVLRSHILEISIVALLNLLTFQMFARTIKATCTNQDMLDLADRAMELKVC